MRLTLTELDSSVLTLRHGLADYTAMLSGGLGGGLHLLHAHLSDAWGYRQGGGWGGGEGAGLGAGWGGTLGWG